MRAHLRLLSCLIVAAVVAPTPAFAIDKDACISASSEGQRLRSTKKLRAAKKQLLACAQAECPAVIRKDCTTWLAEIDESLPTVVFSARDASGGDLSDVRVLVDGEQVAARLDGAAVALDPGEHTVRFEPKVGDAVEQKVVVREGERNRSISVLVGARSAPPPAATSAASVAPPPPPPPTTSATAAPPREPEKSGPPVAAYVAGGVGVVSLGLFAYFGITGRSDVAHLRDTCAPACEKSDEDAARKKLLFADIGLGVGLASLGVATWLFVSDKPAASGGLRVRGVSAAPMPGGGVGFAGGSF